MVAAAGGERDHGERRVLVSVGGESPASEDVEVRNIVSLAEGVEHALLGIGAHAAGSDLMDHAAGIADRRLTRQCFSAGSLEPLLRLGVEIVVHFALIVAEFAMNLEHRDAPMVFLAVG